MSPLPAFAIALNSASSLDELMGAAGREMGDVIRDVEVAIISFDERRQLLTERIAPVLDQTISTRLNVAIDQFPRAVRTRLLDGTGFVDLAQSSADYLKLLAWEPRTPGGKLHLRGLMLDGSMAGILAVYEPRKLFGGGGVDSLEPAAALLELAYARVVAGEARAEAVKTLEDVTRTIHTRYDQQVAALEKDLHDAREAMAAGAVVPESDARRLQATIDRISAEREDLSRRTTAIEHQVASAVAKLESAHVSLAGAERRAESLEGAVRESLRILRAADGIPLDRGSQTRMINLLEKAL
jgi:hypothetical protein